MPETDNICAYSRRTHFILSLLQSQCYNHGHFSVFGYKMAIVLSILTFSFLSCLGAVDSDTNITSCTSLLNDQCRQNLTSCPQPPCEFSCGRTEPQFSCSQDCSPSGNLTTGKLCKALECQATDYCDQVCLRLNCDTTSCNSKDCRQRCVLADCGSMACKQNVVTCDQVAVIPQNGQTMTCAAKSCNQMCQRSSKSDSCDMTCLETVETCEQRGLTSKLHYSCSGGVKNCTQKANLYAIADMECGAESCKQSCSFSRCGMSCSARTLACMQSQDGFGHEEVNMYCDAGVCRQHCGDSKCNMTCSSTVNECYQTCEQGNCLARCDARSCYGVKGMSTSTQSPTRFYPTNGISYIRWTSLSLHLPIITLGRVIFG